MSEFPDADEKSHPSNPHPDFRFKQLIEQGLPFPSSQFRTGLSLPGCGNVEAPGGSPKRSPFHPEKPGHFHPIITLIYLIIKYKLNKLLTEIHITVSLTEAEKKRMNRS